MYVDNTEYYRFMSSTADSCRELPIHAELYTNYSDLNCIEYYMEGILLYSDIFIYIYI